MSNPVRESASGDGVGAALEPDRSKRRRGAARIVLDAPGGDAPLPERVAGALSAARLYPDATILLCGPERQLDEAIKGLGGRPDNVQVVDAPEAVEMHESPVRALREKKRSSIIVGVEMVARGEADAFVSAGNTGAVAAASTLKMGRLKGVQRPGIAAAMKVIDHVVVAIDVGANVDCKPVHLLQYGIMASVFAEGVLGIQNPRVGLLNVGEEEAKGNDLSKQSFELLSNSSVNFVGNVEPGQFMQHGCDILVCDGFVGNVVLKLGEGLLMKLFDWMREQVEGSMRYKLGVYLCRDMFRHLKQCADYTEYGGAPLLGVNGITIITHGTSDAHAIQNAIREARSFVEHQVNERIEEAIVKDVAARSAAT